LPLSADMVDVVVSNCVLNLVPDKKKAFAEMHRVLRKGGHFSVSDIVLTRELPNELRQAAELYAGLRNRAHRRKRTTCASSPKPVSPT
jgi:arsenite methyltransferase